MKTISTIIVAVVLALFAPAALANQDDPIPTCAERQQDLDDLRDAALRARHPRTWMVLTMQHYAGLGWAIRSFPLGAAALTPVILSAAEKLALHNARVNLEAHANYDMDEGRCTG